MDAKTRPRLIFPKPRMATNSMRKIRSVFFSLPLRIKGRTTGHESISIVLGAQYGCDPITLPLSKIKKNEVAMKQMQANEFLVLQHARENMMIDAQNDSVLANDAIP